MRKHRENVHQYEAIFNPNGDGYTVTVPKLPGLVTEGSTLKEARGMVKDAIRCYLEALLKDIVFASPKSFHKEKIQIAV